MTTKRQAMKYEEILAAIGNRRLPVEPVGGWRQKTVDRTSHRTILVGGPEWVVGGVSCWTPSDVRRVIEDYDDERR